MTVISDYFDLIDKISTMILPNLIRGNFIELTSINLTNIEQTIAIITTCYTC